MNSVFLDTNFFLDIFEIKRERHTKAKKVLETFLDNDIQLYTSSDIISTISYFLQKKLDLKTSVVNIEFVVQKVIVFSCTNDDFIELNALILNQIEVNEKLKIDYEDCMQFYLANKHGVKLMLTSDKRFCEGIGENFNVTVVNLDECL
jgi:predicted nucleic acid-binding protein